MSQSREHRRRQTPAGDGGQDQEAMSGFSGQVTAIDDVIAQIDSALDAGEQAMRELQRQGRRQDDCTC